MVKIKVGEAHYALVDDVLHWLDCRKWQIAANRNNIIYARTEIIISGRRHLISMHRIIMGAKKGQMIDHINGNGLDNRKENLRFCTKSENFQNARKRRKCSSIFKGVFWAKNVGKWRSQITPPSNNGKPICVGCFTSEIDAAIAYDKKAIELFGEFARPNFPVRKAVSSGG